MKVNLITYNLIKSEYVNVFTLFLFAYKKQKYIYGYYIIMVYILLWCIYYYGILK